MTKTMIIPLGILVSVLGVSALADTNPFSVFQGNYGVRSCNCIGQGIDQYEKQPCAMMGVEIRSYKTPKGETAWVLDEEFVNDYTMRPLNEVALSFLLEAGEVVKTDLHGDSESAEAIFTAAQGVSHYKIKKIPTGFQYNGGFKGHSSTGVPVDVQCYHSLVKK
jgi:hypothetical protein